MVRVLTPTTGPGGRADHDEGDAAGALLDGRYELGDVVGRGGSATVHRAWDRNCERAVAIKLFATGTTTGPDRSRPEQELRALARLQHPGLVCLLDAGRREDRPYLVMQLVDGPSLPERLSLGPLRVADAVELARHLASALRYVHAHGVTHRDIKPANVLLTADGVPLLADFGIALLVDTTRVTGTDSVVGTAAYMAPEQLVGEDIGPAADIYALGLVLIEAITGRRAFPGTSTESVVARLHRAPAVPRDLPGGLAALLEWMTDRDPARRADARAVVAALAVVADALEPGAPESDPLGSDALGSDALDSDGLGSDGLGSDALGSDAVDPDARHSDAREPDGRAAAAPGPGVFDRGLRGAHQANVDDVADPLDPVTGLDAPTIDAYSDAHPDASDVAAPGAAPTSSTMTRGRAVVLSAVAVLAMVVAIVAGAVGALSRPTTTPSGPTATVSPSAPTGPAVSPVAGAPPIVPSTVSPPVAVGAPLVPSPTARPTRTVPPPDAVAPEADAAGPTDDPQPSNQHRKGQDRSTPGQGDQDRSKGRSGNDDRRGDTGSNSDD